MSPQSLPTNNDLNFILQASAQNKSCLKYNLNLFVLFTCVSVDIFIYCRPESCIRIAMHGLNPQKHNFAVDNIHGHAMQLHYILPLCHLHHGLLTLAGNKKKKKQCIVATTHHMRITTKNNTAQKHPCLKPFSDSSDV